MRSLQTRQAWLVIFAICCCVLANLQPASCEELTAISHADYSTVAEHYAQRLDALETEVAAQKSATARCCPGWFAEVDYLNWKPRQAGLGVAVLDPAGTGVPSGGQPIQSLELGRNSGFRVGLGRRTVTGWDIGLNYTYFESDDSLSFAPGGRQVLAMLSSPATGLTKSLRPKTPVGSAPRRGAAPVAPSGGFGDRRLSASRDSRPWLHPVVPRGL